jgi:hypothetical protein
VRRVVLLSIGVWAAPQVRAAAAAAGDFLSFPSAHGRAAAESQVSILIYNK